jgi:hypothetical protein
MKDTVPQLMTRIVTATQRVLFLLDSTILLKEDIQLNTRVFHWPKGDQDRTVQCTNVGFFGRFFALDLDTSVKGLQIKVVH